ncbi:MAG: hypothetical protein PHT33_04420 [bacterium]|nr:hypothetical protein [bacterium]
MKTPEKDVKDLYRKFLHPGTLRGNLLTISLFIAAFEMFKDTIIENPKMFFCEEFDSDGFVESKTYKAEVPSRHKDRCYASLLWFKEMGAIDDVDLQTYDIIRKYRNELVHEFMSFLVNDDRDFDITKFQVLVDLFTKVEKWWCINIELDINPHMSDIVAEEVNHDDIIPGAIMLLRLMQDVAFGNEPEEGYYYEIFKRGSRTVSRVDM